MKIDLDAIDRAADVYVPGEQIRALTAAIRQARDVLGYLAKVHAQHGPGWLGQKFADQVTAALAALEGKP